MVLGGLCVTQENKLTAVRQKVRPAMRFLLRIDFSGELRDSALRGDTMQAIWSTKENHAITIPRAAAVLANITENLGTAACGLDSEKFSVGEVTDGATIR